MTNHDIDYLGEIGIQRWSLRSPHEGVSSDVSKEKIKPDVDAADVNVLLPQAADDEQPERTEEPMSSEHSASSRQPEVEQAPAPIDTWESLVAELEAAAACAGCHDSNPILGEGDLSADWVWIIDAPSSQDISAQQLLSGRAGQLFDAILQAVGLDRKQIYLTSIFKCPPTENYIAQAGCGGLLRRQLALIEPKNVIVFGEFAAQALLRSNSDLEQLRQSVHQPRTLNSKVISTYSVQEMLSQPTLKARVWADLCLLQQPSR